MTATALPIAIGLFCLAVLWTTALLVAAAAAGELRVLLRACASARSVAGEVALALLFIAGELAGCALCTRLALSRPLFGPASTAGAVVDQLVRAGVGRERDEVTGPDARQSFRRAHLRGPGDDEERLFGRVASSAAAQGSRNTADEQVGISLPRVAHSPHLNARGHDRHGLRAKWTA